MNNNEKIQAMIKKLERQSTVSTLEMIAFLKELIVKEEPKEAKTTVELKEKSTPKKK